MGFEFEFAFELEGEAGKVNRLTSLWVLVMIRTFVVVCTYAPKMNERTQKP